MTEITAEQLKAAVHKAMPCLHVGPYQLLREGMDAALKHYGTTEQQVLERAKLLKAAHPEAANDNKMDDSYDNLIWACQAFHQIEQAANLYAVVLLKTTMAEARANTVHGLQKAAHVMPENVASRHLLELRVALKKARAPLLELLQCNFIKPLPEHELKRAFQQFDAMVCQELGMTQQVAAQYSR